MADVGAELLHAAPSDDFAEWVRPHLAVMRRAAAVGAVGIDPDDVVQEALVRAWRKRTSYDPQRGSARTWLLAITADRARRMRARRARFEFANPDAAGEAIPHVSADLDLRQAVTALAPRQRQAVLLFYYVDLSIEETARLMGCAEGTVKSTLADARKNLAELLGGDHD
jgi:RNA polymerase sigma factor (sigma-70 family)